VNACRNTFGDGMRMHSFNPYTLLPTIRFSYDTAHGIPNDSGASCILERAGRIGIMPPWTNSNITQDMWPIYPSSGFDTADVFLVSTCNARNLLFSTNNPNSRIKFLTTQTAGTQSERMTILGNGKVGIGTATPLFPLHVMNQITVGRYTGSGVAYDASKRGIITLLPSNAGNWYHVDNREPGGSLNFSVGNFAGGSDNDGNGDFMTLAGYGGQMRLGCTFESPYQPKIAAKLTISEDPVTNGSHITYRNSVLLRVERRNDATYSSTHPYTLISAGDNTNETFVVKSDGKVNIGTIFNNTTHNTNYLLSVSGKIACTELIVLPTSNWSDFVFDKNYQLPTLSEVENYIQDNKHLPNIPSAQEVKDNGISIGDMQAKLLQKIEELTLYMIEMKKENKELHTKLTTLQQQLQEIAR
jgi:hypothetical protein